MLSLSVQDNIQSDKIILMGMRDVIDDIVRHIIYLIREFNLIHVI